MIYVYVILALWLLLIILKGWLVNTLIALDSLGSAMTGGRDGSTLSARAGSAWQQDKFRGFIFCPAIDVLMHLVGEFPTWRGHCLAAIKGDQLRAQAILAQRS